jgi:hypothetical protein
VTTDLVYTSKKTLGSNPNYSDKPCAHNEKPTKEIQKRKRNPHQELTSRGWRGDEVGCSGEVVILLGESERGEMRRLQECG